jgi:Sec-independent protein translocase protein TatA
MDILGVGGWEIVAILLIMLIVAGPKRMISWSYTLGKYVSQLRRMWADTAQMLQKEFDDAGVDVQVPKDIPTRGDLNREIGRALTPVTKPFQETMSAAKQEMDSTKQAMSLGSTSLTPKAAPSTTPATPPAQTSAPVTPPSVAPPTPTVQPIEEKPATPANGNGHADFGTWSQKTDGS